MSVAVGTALPARRMTGIDIPRIAGVMELMHDVNPVHVDVEMARSLGLRGPVNQGPANLAYALNMLLAWAGPDARVDRIDFRFHDVVTVGDELVAGGVVTALEEAPGGRRVTCDIWLDRDDGTRTVSATTTLHLPTEEP